MYGVIQKSGHEPRLSPTNFVKEMETSATSMFSSTQEREKANSKQKRKNEDRRGLEASAKREKIDKHVIEHPSDQ
jgi:hypothetical protein